MSNDKTTITLHLPNNQKQTLELSSCIFGGILEEGGHQCGGYNGDIQYEDSFHSMIHIMRAFIKICEEQNMNLEQAKASLEFCLKHAIKTEDENDPLNNLDYDTAMYKMKWDKNKKNEQ